MQHVFTVQGMTCGHCERAVTQAEAREELNRLQARALVHPRVDLAAWLHLAEGLTAYFSAFRRRAARGCSEYASE